ncbi:allantoate deiminase 2 isoform X1 [Benincasa hispida]|uniref:allantoate deiminase 2 isoform X1 n=1 Tax=Benincasa hispida TaxID=102211 RepID=UPI001901AF4C|nr:allantoate deiminase 2 isoform X1 [Benincasa hispida]
MAIAYANTDCIAAFLIKDHQHHHHNHHHHHHSSFSILFSYLLFFLLFSSPPTAYAFTGDVAEDSKNRRADLFVQILKDEAVGKLNELGKVSDAARYLERTFLSPASIKARFLLQKWMEDAGLRTWVDCMGNLHGRTEGRNASAEALLIGSHLDTVVDAGKFDGALGIISAISALKVFNMNGKLEQLKRPIEVIAFSDEEGVRFQSTFLGSAAIAGILPVSSLEISDKSGMTIKDVITESGVQITEESLLQLKYDRKSVWGYVEVHIEQGPVLEWSGFPLGVVRGIAGQTRLKVTVRGSQGHAGTVPMPMRQDPMAATAELIVQLEKLCKQPESYLSFDGHCTDSTMKSLSTSLVCTVGEISTWPSASNVIPGQVTFTVDLRTIDDIGREAVIYEFSNRVHQICSSRSVSCNIERKHDANAIISDSELSSQLKSAASTALKKMVGEIQEEVPVLMSGAGHDAMAMSHLTKVGMLFVRCRGGVSHSPAEHVLDDDIWAAGLAVMEFLENHL